MISRVFPANIITTLLPKSLAALFTASAAAQAQNLAYKPFTDINHQLQIAFALKKTLATNHHSVSVYFIHIFIDSHIPLVSHPLWGPDITMADIRSANLLPECNLPTACQDALPDYANSTRLDSKPINAPIHRCIYKVR